MAAAAGTFTKFLSDSVDAVAALDDLSEKTSLSVEVLSQLQGVARVTGANLDSVAGAAGKFAKSVAEARSGNADLVAAFKAIGVSSDDLRNKAFDELFVDFARSIANAKDPTDALAVAVKLAGKSASEVIPFFKDLAERGLGVANVTTEQAAAAERLQNEIRRLKAEFQAFGDLVATRVVPGLLDFINKLKILSEFSFGEAFSLGLAGVNINNAAAQIEGLDARLKVLRETVARFDSASAGSTGLQRFVQGAAGVNAERARIEIASIEQRIALIQRLVKARDEANREAPERPRTAVALPADVSSAGRGMTVEDLAAAAAMKRIQEDDRRNAEFEAAANREVFDLSERILRQQVARNNAEREAEQQGERRAEQYRREAEAIRDLLDPTRQYQREWETLNTLVAEGALTAEEAARRSNQIFGEYYNSINRGNEGLTKTRSIADELGLTFQSAFENAVVGGNKFRDILKGIEQDIARIIIRKSITEPFGDALSKGLKGVLGSIGSIFGGGSGGGVFSGGDILDIPSFDVGTNYVPRTGLALVHQGEKIIPAAQNTGASGGTTVNNFNIVANDARSFAQMLATPEGRRTIMGVVETSYNRVGRRSGAGAA
ncbi:MAG: hypothetical protein WCS09_02785 [Pseudomonadota bacterium]